MGNNRTRHGGEDPGAIGNGITEKELTLKISNYIYKRLQELGIPVTMTRTTDETINSTDRANRIINAYGNGSDVVVISNHINAGGGDGAEVIYALRNNSTFSEKILNELEKEGQNVRKFYQQRLPSNPIKDYYFIHRLTPNTEAVLVEYGFLDSPSDDVNQLKNNYEKYAEAVVRALANYKNISYVPPKGSNYYTVVKGDTLYKISTKYGISVEKLKELNGLASNTLQIGQVLKVNEDANPSLDNISYTVVKGDNLWSISNKYGVSVDELKSFNNLSSNLLQIGQVLYIPGNINYLTYKVVSGDSLWKISKKYNTTVSKLIDINNLKSSNLSVGQEILVPMQ